MKRRFTILALLITCYTSLWAQRADQILPNVTLAISQQHWEEASNLFRLAIEKDSYISELFFLREIGLNCPARKDMVRYLGDYFKSTRKYEKAYDFYKELSQNNTQDVYILTNCAELEVILGKETDALHTYEKVLSIDGNNLPANIYIGNYYYFAAEKERQQLEKDYKKLTPPTRMQYARYRDELNKLIVSDFGKAKIYLERVTRLFPSVEAKKTLEKIRKIEMTADE